MTIQSALARAVQRLKAADVADPARDARVLLEARLGLAPGHLSLHLQDMIDTAVEAGFVEDVAQRAARRPVAHILGRRLFYGRLFEVTPDVLDPRGDTETLIEVALEAPFARVLDLGTGSGCILLSLLAERAGATGIGTDISAQALKVAARNAEALGVAARCGLIESDWFDAVSGRYDLIVSNPPYIAAAEMTTLAPELGHEPRIALTDEGDGLSAYRSIVAGAGVHLVPGGRLVVEIGWTQAAAVTGLFREAGFAGIRITRDLEGRDRAISGNLLESDANSQDSK